MPKLTRKPPAYCFHKPSGQARVRYHGRDYYLGAYGSRESNQAYARLIAEFSREHDAPPIDGSGPSVSEIILRYWTHAQTYYRHPDGTPTKEHLIVRAALKPLWRPYGSTPASEFRAKQLRLLRDEMIRLDWTRRYINDQVARVKRMFSWAVSEELISEAVCGSLVTVKGLHAGRSAAREKALVASVADETVEATLPHLSPTAADVVRVLRLSGARISEIIGLTAGLIDRSDPTCWTYAPPMHKTSHRGKSRVIHFGPRAIAVLTPQLVASGGGRLFRITTSGVRQSITDACKRQGIPHWHPHQLRHTHATEIRSRFGLEAAQVILGHSTTEMTQMYAEADSTQARAVMAKVG